MFFVSFEKEVFTHDMIKKAMGQKTILVPKVVGDRLLPCEIGSLGGLVASALGILEPAKENLFHHFDGKPCGGSAAVFS